MESDIPGRVQAESKKRSRATTPWFSLNRGLLFKYITYDHRNLRRSIWLCEPRCVSRSSVIRKDAGKKIRKSIKYQSTRKYRKFGQPIERRLRSVSLLFLPAYLWIVYVYVIICKTRWYKTRSKEEYILRARKAKSTGKIIRIVKKWEKKRRYLRWASHRWHPNRCKRRSNRSRMVLDRCSSEAEPNRLPCPLWECRRSICEFSRANKGNVYVIHDCAKYRNSCATSVTRLNWC